MTIPCDKGPALERIETKLDRLAEVVTESAVTRNNVAHLQEKVDSVVKRVKDLEDVPKRAMWAALVAAIVSVVNLLFSHWGSS